MKLKNFFEKCKLFFIDRITPSSFVKKICLSLILSSITYFSICNIGAIEYYGEISFLIYLALTILYYKTDIYNKKYKKEIIIFSILFSFIFVFGRIVYKLQFEVFSNMLSQLLTFKYIIYFIGMFNLLYIIFTNIIPVLCDYKFKNHKNYNIKPKFVFLISFIIILFFWLIYFLRFYPGLLTADSIFELKTVTNNFNGITDHHPVLHILFISLPYNIGMKLFSNVDSAIALCTIFQMTTMSAILSSFIVFLYNRKVNKTILIIIILLYSILPLHGYYSVTMWKDVLFAGIMLLLTMQSIKVIENKNNLRIKDNIIFIIVSLICMFFRNNAIYMYFIFTIATFVLFKKKRKIFIITFLIIFSIYFIVEGPLYKQLNIKKTESTEYLATPLQQIGRMAAKNIEFSKEERKLINNLIPIEELKNSYHPHTVDTIKFNKKYNSKAFDDNKIQYLKMWLNLVIKHPITALDSYFSSTLGYWYPGVEYWSVATHISRYKYNSKVPEPIKKYIDKIESRQIPIVNLQWNIGLCLCIIIIFAYISVKKHGKEYIYPFIPIFGIWLSIMIAAPVFAELRYVYSEFVCLPLLVLLPYIKLKK